jgi:hypothetical protein
MIDFSRRIDAALAHENGHDFLAALDGLDPRYERHEFQERPAPLHRFAAVFHLYWKTAGQGILEFLCQDGDLDFDLAVDSCRELGALRVVDYLLKVAALYPRRRVPVDDRKRYEVVERLESRARDSGSTSPFRALDLEFEGTVESLPDVVRDWVRANREQLEARLAQIPAPLVEAPSELELLQRGLETLQGMSARFHAERQAKLDALAAPGLAVGLLPWRNPGLDPRAVAFYRAASKFRRREWLIVAKRKLAAPRKFDSARHYADEVFQLVGTGLAPKDEHTKLAQMHWAVRNPVVAKARKMPKQVISDGKPIGLLSGANDAIIAVSICLVVHDWMVLTPQGVKAAGVLYGLFEGLAPCPEVPQSRRTSRARKG